ncbi:DUF3846 domain-containing protein [Mycolicibacterium sp. PDY-3]|uniref:DUF3846 domain-containing protein n=1 Tax=Mycolicibacterium sp. PDY-3 TaxID=3376069 RepID=UPI0037B9A8B5
MPRIKTLVIPADEDQDMYVLELEQGDTNKMREVIGGWFGASEGQQIPVAFWYHDEGKIINLPQNDRATLMWWASDKRFWNFDYLAGDVLVTGMADGEGNTLTCPDEFLDLALKTDGVGFRISAGLNTVTSQFRGSYIDVLVMAVTLATNNGAVTGFEVFADT